MSEGKVTPMNPIAVTYEHLNEHNIEGAFRTLNGTRGFSPVQAMKIGWLAKGLEKKLVSLRDEYAGVIKKFQPDYVPGTGAPKIPKGKTKSFKAATEKFMKENSWKPSRSKMKMQDMAIAKLTPSELVALEPFLTGVELGS